MKKPYDFDSKLFCERALEKTERNISPERTKWGAVRWRGPWCARR